MVRRNIIRSLTVAMAIATASTFAGAPTLAAETETAAVAEAPANETPATEAASAPAPTPETSAPETQPTTPTPETPAPETPAPETPAPETPTPETPAPETPAPETPTPETPAPETPTPETPAPEQPSTETPSTETPSTPSTPSETTPSTENAGETEGQTEGSTEGATEGATEAAGGGSQTEATSETDPAAEQNTETEGAAEAQPGGDTDDMMTGPSGEERYDTRYATNEELLANQNIVTPEPEEDFRFEKIEMEASTFTRICTVKEEADEDSDTVGIGHAGDVCYILEETSEDWYYVESGDVRGFAKAEDISKEEPEDGSNSTALQVLDNMSNSAATYTKTSVYEVVVSGTDAMLKEGASIYEDRSTSARVIGSAQSGGSYCAILADRGSDWVFVESGDVRGFAQASDLNIQSVADEDKENTASQAVEPEKNEACFYVITSTKEKNAPSYVRKTMVEYAMQFIGNPYVWGGTSLTNGADCSGFVQSVYAHFGYTLPRVACDQAEFGKQIPVSSAQPGDLVFYASNGYVYHVAMYIGDGMTVQARGRAYGITTCPVGNAIWATSLID